MVPLVELKAAPPLAPAAHLGADIESEYFRAHTKSWVHPRAPLELLTLKKVYYSE